MEEREKETYQYVRSQVRSFPSPAFEVNERTHGTVDVELVISCAFKPPSKKISVCFREKATEETEEEQGENAPSPSKTHSSSNASNSVLPPLFSSLESVKSINVALTPDASSLKSSLFFPSAALECA
jgi:hypothetical protein